MSSTLSSFRFITLHGYDLNETPAPPWLQYVWEFFKDVEKRVKAFGIKLEGHVYVSYEKDSRVISANVVAEGEVVDEMSLVVFPSGYTVAFEDAKRR